MPIYIGKPEAESIGMHMNQWKTPRPITHDLCRSLILGLGGTLRRVVITRVEKNTYYAEMQLEGPGGPVQIDARPSDSIAIALRLEAPIFAPAALLTMIDSDDEIDPDDEETIEPDATASPNPELTAEQLKSYLENLRPEDFGRFNP